MTWQGGKEEQCLMQGDGLVSHGCHAMACCSTKRDSNEAYWCSSSDANSDGMPKAWHKGAMPCAQRWWVIGAMAWLVAALRDDLARAWCHYSNMIDTRACCLDMEDLDMQAKNGLACTRAAERGTQQQHEELDSKRDCKSSMSRSSDSYCNCALGRSRIAHL